MASKPLLLLASFLLFTTCLARQQNQCHIPNFEALEPYEVLEAEGGSTDIWDATNQQFQCAGVNFIRHRIDPNGLLLPSYINAPVLFFVEKGRGIHGVILSGLHETYEQQFDSRESQFRFQDRHQKIETLNQGDMVAIPTGAAHWLHNDGDTELVVVMFLDTQNIDNQLDQNLRRFFLAGNAYTQHLMELPEGKLTGNIFRGLSPWIVAEAFNIDTLTAEKLFGPKDERGHIVHAFDDLQLTKPPQQQEQGGQIYGREENVCSLKLKENIDNPSYADFVNPQAGRITNLNSFKFPVLKQLKLSVEIGELFPNAIQSPHWTINAHNLVYITEGTLRVQIVDNEGNSVFDNVLREGQVVVIPQNFAVIKKAGEQGSRWISFNTNDNAQIANLAGRVSAIRNLPVDVVVNSYQLSREDAQRLKFSQREAVLFTPSPFRGQESASA